MRRQGRTETLVLRGGLLVSSWVCMRKLGGSSEPTRYAAMRLGDVRCWDAKVDVLQGPSLSGYWMRGLKPFLKTCALSWTLVSTVPLALREHACPNGFGVS